MGGKCDWVFGWSTTTHQLHQPILLSQSDVSYLVNYLWDDRKHWLQAMISYANPGLSGLMFIFSHYVAYVRDIQRNPIWEEIRNRVLELIYRYTLIADRDQLPAACAIADANAYQKTLSDIVPMQVDVEDSRAIIAAYIKRFSFDDALDMIKRRDPDVMLRFVPHAIDEGCQGLLSELLNHTIKYGWLYVLEEGDVDEGMAGEGMSDKLKKFIQLHFTSLLMLVKPHEPSSYRLEFSTKEQILNVAQAVRFGSKIWYVDSSSIHERDTFDIAHSRGYIQVF
ncbi:hypothetical protein RSOLAG22IIIB_08525 [Rhizoctonia solani]|uniref:Uncharacterized protein n=1 Tax=Rhizoctonia solani TaxID=456999 RepID=A0A0K6FTC0_9AGAM|nr:hypothetical protein RSOLAG22IIIB_08525 [Rhizoctonia solani]